MHLQFIRLFCLSSTSLHEVNITTFSGFKFWQIRTCLQISFNLVFFFFFLFLSVGAIEVVEGNLIPAETGMLMLLVQGICIINGQRRIKLYNTYN